MQFYLKDGKILVDGGGHPIICDQCPCGGSSSSSSSDPEHDCCYHGCGCCYSSISRVRASLHITGPGDAVGTNEALALWLYLTGNSSYTYSDCVGYTVDWSATEQQDFFFDERPEYSNCGLWATKPHATFDANNDPYISKGCPGYPYFNIGWSLRLAPFWFTVDYVCDTSCCDITVAVFSSDPGPGATRVGLIVNVPYTTLTNCCGMPETELDGSVGDFPGVSVRFDEWSGNPINDHIPHTMSIAVENNRCCRDGDVCVEQDGQCNGECGDGYSSSSSSSSSSSEPASNPCEDCAGSQPPAVLSDSIGETCGVNGDWLFVGFTDHGSYCQWDWVDDHGNFAELRFTPSTGIFSLHFSTDTADLNIDVTADLECIDGILTGAVTITLPPGNPCGGPLHLVFGGVGGGATPTPQKKLVTRKKKCSRCSRAKR